MKHYDPAGGHAFALGHDTFGRLQLVMNGKVVGPLTPVRSFPISAPGEGIALVDDNGTEQIWLDRLEDLPLDQRMLVQEELASREFTPEIRRIRQVSSFATPSRWHVETDKGETTLLLKAEEDIRRLSASTLLIADGHGVQFLIRNVSALDKSSRRLLDHFL